MVLNWPVAEYGTVQLPTTDPTVTSPATRYCTAPVRSNCVAAAPNPEYVNDTGIFKIVESPAWTVVRVSTAPLASPTESPTNTRYVIRVASSRKLFGL